MVAAKMLVDASATNKELFLSMLTTELERQCKYLKEVFTCSFPCYKLVLSWSCAGPKQVAPAQDQLKPAHRNTCF